MNTGTLENAIDRLEETVQFDEQVPHDWRENARRYLDQLAKIFEEQILPGHAEQFEQIREEDLALQPRIKQMRAEDRDIVAHIEATRALLQAKSQGEELDASQIAVIVDEVQTLVRRIREQQKAMSKWFSEAFLRDRGFPSA